HLEALAVAHEALELHEHRIATARWRERHVLVGHVVGEQRRGGLEVEPFEGGEERPHHVDLGGRVDVSHWGTSWGRGVIVALPGPAPPSRPRPDLTCCSLAVAPDAWRWRCGRCWIARDEADGR